MKRVTTYTFVNYDTADGSLAEVDINTFSYTRADKNPYASTEYYIANDHGTINAQDTILTTFSYDTNNNVILAASGDVYIFSNVTYDTYKNPFYNNRLIFFLTQNQEPDEESGYFGGLNFSVNNVTGCKTNYNGIHDYDYSASSFVYNSNGYPISANYSSSNDFRHAGPQFFYYSN